MTDSSAGGAASPDRRSSRASLPGQPVRAHNEKSGGLLRHRFFWSRPKPALRRGSVAAAATATTAAATRAATTAAAAAAVATTAAGAAAAPTAVAATTAAAEAATTATGAATAATEAAATTARTTAPPPPPPKPPGRSSRGRASLTTIARPSRAWPFMPLMAAWASASEPISTKPKPLERPVSRSIMTLALETLPYCANACCRSSSRMLYERLPT